MGAEACIARLVTPRFAPETIAISITDRDRNDKKLQENQRQWLLRDRS